MPSPTSGSDPGHDLLMEEDILVTSDQNIHLVFQSKSNPTALVKFETRIVLFFPSRLI